MDLILALTLEVLKGVASLALICLGLSIIFGMMRIINLAHGEFIMLGGYAAIISNKAGINIWFSILIIAPLVVGVLGLIIERLLMRHLYGRQVDSMLATWGLSLFIIGVTTMIFGNTTTGISAPGGFFEIGSYRLSTYNLFIIAVAIVVFAMTWVVLRWTKFGLIARSTMQNANMTAAMGVNPRNVYAITFGMGAALSGLAGGVLAPITGIVPTIGVAYIAKAFITVISGGAAVLTGTLVASGLFGVIDQTVAYLTTPVVGEVALLASAIVLLRFLPQGITGRFFRRAT